MAAWMASLHLQKIQRSLKSYWLIGKFAVQTDSICTALSISTSDKNLTRITNAYSDTLSVHICLLIHLYYIHTEYISFF